MRLLIGMDHRRQQQGIEHRLREAQAGAVFLQLQEAHVERRVVCDEHRILTEGMERRQHDVDVRLAEHHVLGDAVNGDRFRFERNFRIDDLVKNLLPQQAVIDNARRADLDDLVAIRRFQTRGFGIEHGIGQIRQLAV